MFKRHGIVWVLALGLVLVGGVAVADEGAGKDHVAKLNKAAADAKVTFAQAIETAQKEVADGKVIGAELESEDGKAMYEVEMLVGDAVKEVTVCAIEGKVVEVEDEAAEAKEADDKEEGEKEATEDAEEIAAAKKALPLAKVTFVQALEAAGKEVKDGKPVEIELTLIHDMPFYAVELVTADAVKTVHIDAVEGKVHAGH